MLLSLPLALMMNSQDPPQDTIPSDTIVQDTIKTKVDSVQIDTIYMELKEQQQKLNELIEKKRKK